MKSGLFRTVTMRRTARVIHKARDILSDPGAAAGGVETIDIVLNRIGPAARANRRRGRAARRAPPAAA